MLVSKIKKLLLALLIVIPAVNSPKDCCSAESDGCTDVISKNLWQPHAFSDYASREILILQGLNLDTIGGKKWINRIGFATEYMQSFGNNCQGLGAMPFWSGTNSMTIGNNDGTADLDAYQFGMGNVKTPGVITLSPKVQHVGTEFLWYVMQNEDKPGAYFKVIVPIGAMRVTSNVCEKGAVLENERVEPPYPKIPLRFQTVTEAFYGGMFSQDPLYLYGKIGCEAETTIRLGDIGAVVGANFIAKKNGHFGIGLRTSCPTGNVPKAIYMLEPIFGRAGHWGLGAEISAHYSRSSMYAYDSSWTVWLQAEVMHLFAGRQPSWRSFDLKANGPGSKYLLLQRYAWDPTGSYFVQRGLHPAINITTLPVKSTFGVEGNCAVLLDYTKQKWNVSLGAEAWGRSREHLCINNCRALQDRNQDILNNNLNDYAVVGRQLAITGGSAPFYCEPLARINKSVPFQSGVNNYPEQVKNAALPENRIPKSYNEALDISGASAAGIVTGKVLGEVGYTWSENNYIPHVSVFAGAEFASESSHTVNLWSVGLQSSLQF